MYVRMKREEIDTPAPYLIVNIYNDDHHRSLFGWGSLRLMTRDPDVIREGIQRPTMPYVEVNPAAGTIGRSTRIPAPPRSPFFSSVRGTGSMRDSRIIFPSRSSSPGPGMYNQGPETSHVETHGHCPRIRPYPSEPGTTSKDWPESWKRCTCRSRAVRQHADR